MTELINNIAAITGWETIRMVVSLVGVLAIVVVNALILTWAERKVSGRMQRRI